MSKLSIAAPPAVTLRWILQRDLPVMLQLEQQPPAPQWTQKEFKAVFQSADTAGWVADIAGRVVGFLVYRVTSQPDLVESVAADFPGWRSYAAAGQVARKPLGISLLNLAVAPSWRRHGIGRTLLGRIGQKLQQPQDCIEVTVPESNLPVQLLLRDAGYKAVSVQRDYYGAEDGYRMELRRE